MNEVTPDAGQNYILQYGIQAQLELWRVIRLFGSAANGMVNLVLLSE